MRYRSAVILGAAALAVCAGSESPTPAPVPERPRAAEVAYLIPPADSFDNLRPGESSARLPVAAPTRAAVTTAARPIARPPRKPPARTSAAEPSSTTGVLIAAYRAAVASAPSSCHLPATLLAAIGQVESGSVGGRSIDASHRVVPPIYGPLLDGGAFASIPDTDGGRIDGDGQWDRAVGPMQFIPGTWSWSGADGDEDGIADPQNVYDSAAAAGDYLCRGGRDLSSAGHLRAAVLSYNHSGEYLAAVLEWKDYFAANGLAAMGDVAFRVGSGGRASDLAGAEPTASPTTSVATTSPAATDRGSRARTRQPEPAQPTAGTPAPATTTPAPSTPAPATTTPAATTTPPSSTTTTPDSTTTTSSSSTTTTSSSTTTPPPSTTTATGGASSATG